MSDDESGHSMTLDGSNSQQRLRNVLTLEERVAAIRQYDIVPMYSKISKNFNCSWEQIKSIVANRQSILEFYEATRRNKMPNTKGEELRRRKLIFLGQCLYEYIQRAQYHLHADINEELIRTKALEFRDLMHIDNFMPNKPWINHFKAEYNITLSNRQITMTRRPPRSLDLRDIMSYSGKHASTNGEKLEEPGQPKSSSPPLQPAQLIPTLELKPAASRSLYRTKTQASVSSANQATLEEVQQRRKRKISFLEKALYEYIQRSQFHHSGRLDMDNLRKVAISLRDILKIENFFPDKMWFMHFKSHYNFSFSQADWPVTGRRIPLSLDLRDIVSYCGRREQRDQPLGNITLAPQPADELPVAPFVHQPFVEPKAEPDPEPKAEPNAEDDDEDDNNNVDETEADGDDDDDCVAIEVPTELIEIKDDDEDHSTSPSKSNGLKRDSPSLALGCPPSLKIRKIESPRVESSDELEYPVARTPDQCSEDSVDAELPRSVQSYGAALRLLKTLEDFALTEENYRAIGLLTQLEKVFEESAQKARRKS